jgi:hypothetical protein
MSLYLRFSFCCLSVLAAVSCKPKTNSSKKGSHAVEETLIFEPLNPAKQLSVETYLSELAKSKKVLPPYISLQMERTGVDILEITSNGTILSYQSLSIMKNKTLPYILDAATGFLFSGDGISDFIKTMPYFVDIRSSGLFETNASGQVISFIYGMDTRVKASNEMTDFTKWIHVQNITYVNPLEYQNQSNLQLWAHRPIKVPRVGHKAKLEGPPHSATPELRGADSLPTLPRDFKPITDVTQLTPQKILDWQKENPEPLRKNYSTEEDYRQALTEYETRREEALGLSEKEATRAKVLKESEIERVCKGFP